LSAFRQLLAGLRARAARALVPRRAPAAEHREIAPRPEPPVASDGCGDRGDRGNRSGSVAAPRLPRTLAEALAGVPGFEVLRAPDDRAWLLRPVERRQDARGLVVRVDGEIVLHSAGGPPWELPERTLAPVRRVEFTARAGHGRGRPSRTFDVRTRSAA
jgi:hypothetical protein